MLIHLEPVGGISGDMFIGAMLNCWPELAKELPGVLSNIGLAEHVITSNSSHRDHTLSGSKFEVELKSGAHFHHHTPFRDIRSRLLQSGLSKGVIERAIDIFSLLAEVEGRAHGCSADDVSFHEVGAWDSITDITFAAYLIDAINANEWSVSAIPMGSGQVQSQHGMLPVPAPATHFLLEGMTLFDDGFAGERVTPTGAAILKHLAPGYGGPAQPAKLIKSGIGFGTRVFKGKSNILRVSQFETLSDRVPAEEISVINFEIDDQTPEDLAVGIDRLRQFPGVIDVTQNMVIGKKGRQSMQVQVLCTPDQENAVMGSCFDQTTTLGIRYQRVQRQVLKRSESKHDGIRVKTAMRPNALTAKADIDDVSDHFYTHNQRSSARAASETAALKKEKSE